MSDSARPVIVFDALCVLCSANAQFVLRHDRKRAFRLASMQSDFGQSLYRKFGIDPRNPETLIVVVGEKALRNSDAVIAIWAALDLPWRLLATVKFVPRALRDPLYRWVARNRYRMFGQRETCWLPRPEDADRLL